MLSTRLPALLSQGDEDPLFNDDWEASTYLYPRQPKNSPTKHQSRPPITLLVTTVGPNILFDPRRESVGAVHVLAHQIAQVAIRHGGVLSGEHGIGTMKRPFMREAVDPVTLGALWSVKHALDPHGALNPGKILPDEAGDRAYP